MPRPDPLPTDFLPAERLEGELLTRALDRFAEEAERFSMLDCIPEVVLIVDANRQVVYANEAAKGLDGVEGPGELLGKRYGEVIHCRQADQLPGGCGTTVACRTCGLQHAVLTGLEGEACTEECQIGTDDLVDSLDLRASARPIRVGGEFHALVMLRDIADEKRRQVLERTFFHDILNTAGGLQGYTELMQMCEPDQLADLELDKVLPQLASQLVEEIQTQRMLVQAERGQVELRVEELAPGILLRQQADAYGRHQVALGRRVEVAADPSAATLRSDSALVQRVLGNMIKNALEACPEGGCVELSWSERDGGLAFEVKNPTVMPEKVQLQVFKRSFSTKGAGRGIGTYSMKLFGETYLGGRVGFESAADAGTTFTLWLPLAAG